MKNRMVMEQVTRYNNITQKVQCQVRIHTGQNCMRNRMVMEQVTKDNNVTQEVNIQVRIV